jgi:cell division septum initiation protein DivIVA
MSEDDHLHLPAEQETSGFDVVLRGYDRRQVEDYVERVEVALAEADREHLEDGERLAALSQEVAALQVRLADAEQRAAGLPEPASRIGERLATMLRLAEEEAEQIVTQAQERAAASTAERTEDLDRRELDVRSAAAEAEQTRLDAQRDAEAVRSRAQQEAQALQADARRQADAAVGQAREEADHLVRSATEEAARKKHTADEDVAILHEDARTHAHELVADARRQVEELRAQRDAIAAQLQSLRETLSAAVQPLGQPPAT